MADKNSAKKSAENKKSKTATSVYDSKSPARTKDLVRALPHNIDAEEGIIASIILDESNTVINKCVASKVRADYFYSPQNQIIFEALVVMLSQGKPIDEITLAEYLSKASLLEKIGGVDELLRIVGRIETYAHANHWLEIVREKYFLRTLITTFSDAIENAYANTDDFSVFLGNIEQKVLAIGQDKIGDTVRSASDQVDSALRIINDMINSKGAIAGVPTGFNDIDTLMRGLHSNEMIVIAGRPGTGKTSIALNIAENALFGKTQTPTLIFSLEMLAEQLYMRMISARARVNQRQLSSGYIASNVMEDINIVGKEFKKAPLWIDDTSNLNILELMAKARRLNQKLESKGSKLGLVIVDYLQLLKGLDSRVSREQQVAEISRGMKAMAKELRVPVIVLAQLNRESEKGERDPKASDLRESGSIEQDADAIILLSRQRKEMADQTDNSIWKIRVELAKQRNGPTGVVNLMFNRDITRYENYAKDSDIDM